MRIVYLSLGWLMVVLGVAGIFLPVLPTTPFLLVAAWLFSRSSPRLEAWLLTHPTFGKPLTAWKREGAIPLRARVSAVVLMVISYGFFWWGSHPSIVLAVIVGAVMFGSALFVATRPEPTTTKNKPEGRE